jgi:hypothetical protein
MSYRKSYTATVVIHLKASTQAADAQHHDLPCSASEDLQVRLEESEWTSDADLVVAPAVAERSKIAHSEQQVQVRHDGRVRVGVVAVVTLGSEFGVELVLEVEVTAEGAWMAARYSIPEGWKVDGELAGPARCLAQVWRPSKDGYWYSNLSARQERATLFVNMAEVLSCVRHALSRLQTSKQQLAGMLVLIAVRLMLADGWQPLMVMGTVKDQEETEAAFLLKQHWLEGRGQGEGQRKHVWQVGG